MPRSPPLELRTGTHRPHPSHKLSGSCDRDNDRCFGGFESCLPVISRLCDLVEGVGAGWRGKKIRRHLNLLSVRGSSGVADGDKERGRGLKQRFVLHCCLSPRTEQFLGEHNEEELQKNAELSRLRLEPPAAFLSPSPAPECPTYFSSCPKVNKQFWSSCD